MEMGELQDYWRRYYFRNPDMVSTICYRLMLIASPEEHWLAMTTSILVQAQKLEEKLTDWNMNVDKIHHNWQKYGLNDRQIDGLIYAVNTGIITRKDYIEIAGVSAVTASKELADMVTRGLLYPEGMGRSRKYRIILDKESES